MRKAILVTSLLLSTTIMANDFSHAFFDHDPRYLPDNIKGNITKKEFFTLTKKIKKLYKKEVWKRGGVLKVKADWRSKRVNAYASRIGPIWKLTALGGLARHPMINYDGYALVLCHEMGHHLGGAPKWDVLFKRWTSFEGQADYWATLKCFRHLFLEDDNVQYLKDHYTQIPAWAQQQCEKIYYRPQRIALCIRSIIAGQTMANLIADYHDNPFPRLSTPDQTIVEETKKWHPNAQCRLDTFAQGALCDEDSQLWTDDIDPNIATCNRKRGDQIGTRPLCWFHPED